jgi:hypothetical protein
VDVEQIRFTDKQLGIDGDPDLIALDSGAVIITGTLDTTADFKVATDKFVVDAAGNTAAAGTLEVTGATTLTSTLELAAPQHYPALSLSAVRPRCLALSLLRTTFRLPPPSFKWLRVLATRSWPAP